MPSKRDKLRRSGGKKDGGEGAAQPSDALLVRLRRTLFRGDLVQAEDIQQGLERSWPSMDESAGKRLEEAFSLHDGIARVVGGIAAILDGDPPRGIAELLRVTDNMALSPSLRWAALIWITWAAEEVGARHLPLEAAGRAVELAEDLDLFARSNSLAVLGETQAMAGENEEALRCLKGCQELFRSSEDMRGEAAVMLAQARVLLAMERGEEALQRALDAWDLDPEFPDPALFAVHVLQQEEDLPQVRSLLARCAEEFSANPEVERQLCLMQMTDRGEVPLWVVNEYNRLRLAPAGHDTISELEGLMVFAPGFLHLRETLAWKLLKVGRVDEARNQFDLLSRREIPEELRSSVLLGRGLLASLSGKHRQTGARMKAVVTALPEMLRAAKERGEELRPRELTTEEHVVVTPREAPPIWARHTLYTHNAICSGELSVFSLSELLSMLSKSRRTGTLVLSSSEAIGAVFFRHGRITGAAAPSNPSLGSLLASRGSVSRKRLDRALRSQETETPEQLVGEILLDAGDVTRSALRQALGLQVAHAVAELLGWQEGNFAFSPEVILDRAVYRVELELAVPDLLRMVKDLAS